MMEPIKKVSIWSLPGGDRRGTSGADAGRHSMQAIGGEGNGRPSAGEPEQCEPNRRYNLRSLCRSRNTSRTGTEGVSSTSAVDMEATRLASIEERSPGRTNWAEKDSEAQSSISSHVSLFSSIPSSPLSYLESISQPSSLSPLSRNPHSSSTLAEDVVQTTVVDNAVPTKAKSRTRKKWTEEMNIFILRTYLILTNLESNTRLYLTELHSQFSNKFPDMQVSRQRIGDQRRAIVRNNLLTETCVTTIRDDVETYLLTQQHPTQQLASQTRSTQRIHWTLEHNETIIRAYYRITQLETNQTAYRKPLHQHFINVFPHLSHISEQRIADQRRIIIAKKFIDDDRLQLIRQEVASELDTQPHTNVMLNEPQEDLNATIWYDAVNDNTMNNTHDTLTLQTSQSQSNLENNTENETISEQSRNSEIDEIFNLAQQYFKDTPPTERPFIPKQRATKKFAKIVGYVNEIILPEHVNIDTTFETLQTIIYCTAWTAAKANGTKFKIPPQESGNKERRSSKPNWQKRLEIKVVDLRKNIGRLTQYIQGNRSRTLTKQVNTILEKYKTHTTHEEPNSNLTHYLDTLKQKLIVVSSRLRRYKACTCRKTQNSQFFNNEKKFYQSLTKSTHNIANSSQSDPNINTLDPTELRRFWADIWENPVGYNEDAEWIKEEQTSCSPLEPMEYLDIPIDVFQNVLKGIHNWKAPGSDHMHSYWYKKFTRIHPFLYNHINNFIQNPHTMPTYITTGITYMIPKDTNDLTNPAKYRPITCLQTIYKIITACISQLIYSHINTNQLLAEQQKGCKKFSQGCKEQLILDSIILKQAEKNKEDLYSVYIDYKKAYDSVPHSWLIKILNIYKIHPQIVKFLGESMARWTTRVQAQNTSRTVESAPIRIQRGIFQGDALSPLWFCLALNPLSNSLNSTHFGYLLDNIRDRLTNFVECRINHLLYMDDIKIYANTQEDLEHLIQITEQFSLDISMKFGIDKCKINSIRAGLNYQHAYDMQTGETIESLSENETYKYLGYNQSKQIHHKEIKTKLTQNFKHRLYSILKTQLYSKNIIKAINTFAIPILTYSFGVINWTKTELKDLQRLINVTMTKQRKHHPRACVQRQVLPRIEGGRGIINVQNLHNRQISTLRSYFYSKSQTSILHRAAALLDSKHTPLNLQNHEKQDNEVLTDIQTLIAEWSRKSLHGRHHHDLSQPTVDKKASNEWLNRGELFPETEGFMIAIQDQVIETRNYQKYIMKIHNLPTDLCRRCNSSSETIQHITGACKALAQTDYKFRHDQVANIIHQRIAAMYNLINASVKPTPYYKYIPETVLENTTHKLYFDRAILTDKTTHYNRPDLTLLDKSNNTALLIDIAIPNTHNLQNTIAEKLAKYVDLKNEITRMWRLQNVSIVPIVLSSTGVVPKQLFQSLDRLNLPKHTYALLQKAVILNTCRIVRKFLQTDLQDEGNPNLNRH